MSNHDADQEREWVSRAASGSLPAFESLSRAYEGDLLGFFVRRTRTVHDAEDLVQTTLIKVYRNVGRYKARWTVRTWIFAIARRGLIDHYRKTAAPHRNPGSLEDAPEPVDVRVPGQHLDEQEQAEALWQEAERLLPEPQSTALWLHYREGMSVKEVAQSMGRSAVDVKVLMHRARKKLAESLEGNPGRLRVVRATWMQPRWEQSPC